MNYIYRIFFIAIIIMGVSSCEEEIALPDNLVEFESDQLGLLSTETELNINIAFSRAISQAGSIVLNATLTGLEYGSDFTTDPAIVDNKLTLQVAAGAASTSFKLIKANGATFLGDEQIKFSIESVSESIVLGGKKELTITFAEIIANLGSLAPNVGGEQQPNKVFIDLSGNRQSFISRSGWDLGFNTDSDKFRVIINSSSGMLARVTTKTDMNAVSASDTVGLGNKLSLPAIFAALFGPPPSWLSETIGWIDDPAGSLSTTAIAEISATDADNKVYIINRGKNPDGTERGWKKVRILRNGAGYTLQHADIAATSFTSVNVTKDNAYLFNYINFNSGLVEAEPKKDQWDIAFTVFTNTFPSDPSNPSSPLVPFEFKDYIIQNRYEVETAQVLMSSVSYENFTEANLAGVTFSTSQKAIGSNWRSIPSNSSTPPSLRTDRFYLIKDAAGNIYKLKFTALTNAGVRGFPAFDFALVVKGS